MCGINGIWAYRGGGYPIDRDEVIRTRDHMRARGPDGAGLWCSPDGSVGIGHRRLSIIDLSEAGAQPMESHDGALIVTFNGEIYNYRELRRGLESRGAVFKSHSDTEVLLHLYAEKGEAMVHDLRGMFAFAIWNQRQRQLFLARDPMGIKPLYFADDGRTVRFASQVKALLAGGAISRDPEPAGHAGFFLWGSVPEPFTMYRDIRALPAGCYLVIGRDGAKAPVRYHSIASVYRQAEAQDASKSRRQDESREAMRSALLDCVRHHLVADVPVGAFLSAGIDSGALVGLMRDAGQSDIQTVTLSFDEYRGGPDDEGPLAAEVARLYGARHTNRVVTEAEFQADLPRIMQAMDQPSIDGINSWFISKAMQELGVKVAVSGLGGDELVGGYGSFQDIPHWVGQMRAASRIPFVGRALRRLFTGLGLQKLGVHPKAAGMLELGGTYSGAYQLRRGLFMPWELSQLLDPDVIAEGVARLEQQAAVASELEPMPHSAFAKVATLESGRYMRNQLLRDTDWASMAHGLEVRVPLVDAALLRQVATLGAVDPALRSKQALALAPSRPLPDLISSRRKTGFTTPIGKWLQNSVAQRDFGLAPALAGKGIHWSRRWAYCVHTHKPTATAERSDELSEARLSSSSRGPRSSHAAA